MLLLQPFAPAPTARVERVRADLAALDANAFVGPRALATRGVYPPKRLYLLGMLSLRIADTVTAERYAAALDRYRGRTSVDSAFVAYLAGVLRGAHALADGDPSRALTALGEPAVPPDSILPDIWSYARAHARWVRAEALRQLGRDTAALRWYATFPDPAGYDAAYVAPAHLRRARIHERLGSEAEAARHYARFLAHWNDADPALRPRVEDVRRRLAGLRR